MSGDGSTLYVAAFGSSKIGVYSTAALENDTFVPSTANQIPLSGGGPTGMVLDAARGRMYVLTRFDNAISTVNTATRHEIAHQPMYSPEPESVVSGRRFLYDARLSSSHGDSSCASCHIFGDFDSLAWDLGNPDASVIENQGPFVPLLPEFEGLDPLFGIDPDFHPMKGPMTTQSLRGMANQGPMHWRGDRTGGNDEPSAQPNEGRFDEEAAFNKFNPAFQSLLGRSAQLDASDMQKFTDFILQIVYPPNPIRHLDSSLTPAQQAGSDFFNDVTSILQGPCAACHKIDRDANPDEGAHAGFFGTDGRSSAAASTQIFKIPHIRNVYQKVGMFGAAVFSGSVPPDPFLGDQVRGFGFQHDGSIPDMFHFSSFFDVGPSNPVGIPPTPEGTTAKMNMAEFTLASDSNMAPIVGQQITLTAMNRHVVAPRVDLLMARADEGECDLVAKGRIAAADMGFLYVGAGQFTSDRDSLSVVPDPLLRLIFAVSGGALTYTCAPPGSGVRIGIDRDLDGYLDGDEQAAGSDPADPDSTP